MSKATVHGIEFTRFDFDVLRLVRGEEVPGLGWGAAVSVAIEFLAGVGCVEPKFVGDCWIYKTTKFGKLVMDDLRVAFASEAAP